MISFAHLHLYWSLVRTETLTSIAYAILVPNVMFVLSLVVLVYWYCPYCQAKCKKYEQQTDVRDNHYEWVVSFVILLFISRLKIIHISVLMTRTTQTTGTNSCCWSELYGRAQSWSSEGVSTGSRGWTVDTVRDGGMHICISLAINLHQNHLLHRSLFFTPLLAFLCIFHLCFISFLLDISCNSELSWSIPET